MDVTRGALALIIIVALGCAGGIWGIKGLIEADVTQKVVAAKAQSDYKSQVKDYKTCVTRQQNTKISNDRAGIQKEFMVIAAKARNEAGKSFVTQGNLSQARVNFDTANQEFGLASRIYKVSYIACSKPVAPLGVKAASLPKAPYNYLVK